MTEYLIVVAVGPVQEFIAAARKSRDLWFGSWMVSELSRAVARFIGWQNLIFPTPSKEQQRTGKQPYAVVNKIVGIVVADNPDTYGQRLRSATEKRLREIRNRALAKITDDEWQQQWRGIAEKQIDDLIELTYAFMPCDAENYRDRHLKNNPYRDNLGELEYIVAIRKNTRDFAPVSWGNDAPKSSIDGLRESVIPEEWYPQSRTRHRPADLPEEVKRKTDKLYTLFRARPSERLSGVDLLKRLGKPSDEETVKDAPDHFASTSHIAALPYLMRLEKAIAVQPSKTSELLRAWNDYVNTIDPPDGNGRLAEERTPRIHPILSDYDGGLLYESRLTELLDRREHLSGTKDTVTLATLRTSLTTVMATFNQVVGLPASAIPSPYYALLHADGDGMGKAINAITTPIRHRELSATLSEFADEVKTVVEQYKGYLVYAGGDDVLAFLPLNTVLDCATDLSSRFEQLLHPFQYKDTDVKPTVLRSPTLSMGVVVTHHLESLSDAMRLVREAESKAKEILGKNALAITVSKRSGVDRTIKGQWGQIEKRLHWLVASHHNEEIPTGFAYELQQLDQDFAGMRNAVESRIREAREKGEEGLEKVEITKRNKMIRDEVMRILKRKQSEQGTKAVSIVVLDTFQAHYFPNNKPVASLQEMADEIIIAKLFADAVTLASYSPSLLGVTP